MQQPGRLPLVITLLGAVPFVVLSAMVALRLTSDLHWVISVLLTYSGVILSFMGGVHWGLAVLSFAKHPRTARILMVESVLPSLIAWTVLLHGNIYAQLLTLTLVYSLLWAVDSLLFSNDLIPDWFFTVRCVITPIVVVSLYVAYFGLV